jgi:hypothetical protein
MSFKRGLVCALGLCGILLFAQSHAVFGVDGVQAGEFGVSRLFPFATASRPGGDPLWNYFIISGDFPEEIHTTAAFNSQRREYLVVWYNDRAGNDDIRAVRLSKDGRHIGGPFYISAGAGAERRNPDVAYNSQKNEYLVVWEHIEPWNNIKGRRISATGQLLGSVDIDIKTGSNLTSPARPAVSYAATSDNYLVVWQETFHPTVVTGIAGQILSSTGNLVGMPIDISSGAASEPRQAPDVAYNRSRNEHLVVWQEKHGDFDIFARRVTAAGLPLQPAAIEIGRYAAEEYAPSAAGLPTSPNQGKYLVVWELRHSPTDRDIYSRIVNGDGTTASTIIVSASTRDENSPVVAGNQIAHKFLVAWTQANGAFRDIRARTFTQSGQTLGPERSLMGGWTSYPDLASATAGDLGDFLVVFQDNPLLPDRDVYGRLWGNRLYLPLNRKP